MRVVCTVMAVVMLSGGVGTSEASAVPSPGALPPQLVLEVPVTGIDGVPDDAVAVAVNVTVTNPTGAGYVTVYPCDQPQPETSNLNYMANLDIPNSVIAKVSGDGSICVATSAVTDVIVDIAGYFPADSPVIPIPNPERLLDTRSGVGAPAGQITADTSVPFRVAGVRSTPASAGTVIMNMTAVDPSAGGFATVYPCGQPVPDASNLNFTAGETVPNLVIARVGTNGQVCVKSTASMHVLADVAAYIPTGAEGFTPIARPERILDTRTGLGAPAAPLRVSAELGFQVGGRAGVPSEATAVVLNMTATRSAAAGYVTLYPCGAPAPDSSNLNFGPGRDVPNLVIAKVGMGGQVCALASTGVDLLADVAGYFTGMSTYVPIVNPRRVADTRQDGALRCNLVALESTGGAFAVQDLRTGSSRSYPFPAGVIEPGPFQVVFTPDCRSMLIPFRTAAGSELFEMQLATGVAQRLGGTAGVLTLLDDGVLASTQGLTQIYDARTQTRLLDLTPVLSPGNLLHRRIIDISPSGLVLTIEGPAANLPLAWGLWDLYTGDRLGSIGTEFRQLRQPDDGRISPDDAYVAVQFASPTVQLEIRTLDGATVVTFRSPTQLLRAPIWAGPGTLILCQGIFGTMDVGTYRWDIFAAEPTLIHRGRCAKGAA